MKVPGFIAEISLYKSHEHYNMIGTATQTRGGVQLSQIESEQSRVIGGCNPSCLRSCNRCRQQFGLQGNCITRCCRF